MTPILWRLAILLTIFTAGFAGGVSVTRNHYRPIIADMKIKADEAVIKQQVENVKIVQQHDAEALSSSQDFINHIAKLEKDNHALKSVASHITCTGGLLQPAASTSSVSAASPTAGKPDAAPANDLVAALPEQCAVTTQQLMDLQGWVRAVSASH